MDRRGFLNGLVTTALATASGHLGGVGVSSTPSVDRGALGSLVALLRDTPRDRLLETLVPLIRDGLAYEHLLGAVAEAAAREVAPYPVVGFKYHAFMVLQAVHRTTVRGDDADHWLPILWAADLFKDAQARDALETGWTLPALPDAASLDPARAETLFVDTLQRWDTEAADIALVGCLAAQPLSKVFDVLFRYAARDFRHIGHKPITAANCHRLIRVLGPVRAAPMLRSLTYAIQNHGGGTNPALADLPPDRPWRQHLQWVDSLSGDWPRRQSTFDPTSEILAVLRQGSATQASRFVLDIIRRGAGADQIWPALFLAAGELLLRQNGIIAVHANTSVNALHYAYRHAEDEHTRGMLLLQAAAFMPLFRESLEVRRDLRIDQLEPADAGLNAAQIFDQLATDRVAAARTALGYLKRGGSIPELMRLGRHYTVLRNTGYHDYKFTEAAFENARYLGSPWRERYLAASVLYLNGPSGRQHPFIIRAREHLRQDGVA